ncbi:MAG: GGDEF domain-containing protein [Hyphomicrobiales bacterium]|nr:GGDEF domain-containing protein [Hyphomicrobiales bacterium]
MTRITETVVARSAAGREMRHAAPSPRSAWPGRLPPSLMSWCPPVLLLTGAGCDALLGRRRVAMIATRLQAAVTVLAVAVIGWIAVDYLLFLGDWSVVLPLAIARLVLAASLLALARLELRRLRSALTAIAVVLTLVLAFSAFAHAIAVEVAPTAISGHVQYALLPVVLVAGLAILPLTLVEVLGLSSLPVAALALELASGHGATGAHVGAHVATHVGAALAMMLGVTAVTVVSALSQLRLLADMHALTLRDPLTGALTRPAGIELMNLLLASSQRSGQPCSVALVDLDCFKAVNDRQGREAGDRLLHEIAQALSAKLRPNDALVRWSGEELVLALPDTSAPEAMKLVAAWCRGGLCRQPDVLAPSVGIAEHYADAAQDLPTLIGMADERMYAAKALGRDRVNAPYGLSERIGGQTSRSANVTSIGRHLNRLGEHEPPVRGTGAQSAVIPA